MNPPIAARPLPTPASKIPLVDRTSTLKNVRRLIWLYMILLMIEGALRKWVVPEYSNPLLIIRDPVVIAIYLLAIRARVFPRNAFVTSLIVIALLSWLAGVLVLLPYLPLKVIVLVTGYGFRSNFLHLPLIFVFAKVFDAEDVKKIGWWVLVGMIPMGLLMVAQFQASPESFINRTAGLGEALQIQAGGGKIRPPGTFSFISGPIFYVGAATAFLIHGALSRAVYQTWLLLASGFVILIAVAVSGSRACVASALLVVAMIGLIFLVKPAAVNRLGRVLILVLLSGFILSRLPIFKEGVGVLSDRFTSSAEAAETTIAGGMVERVFIGFTEGFKVIDRLPIAGYGLGIGTNGGARFLVGRAAFLLAENEWSRILLESGPIVGLAFILWRTALTGRLFYLSFIMLRRGVILPILLFSSSFIALLNGSLGQPTNLGFAAVLNGLCLASMQNARPPKKLDREKPKAPPRPVGRSAYAERLHASPDSTNGVVDR